MLDKEACMGESAVDAFQKALIFTIDAYSHSGLVSDSEITLKLQETLRHLKRKTLSSPSEPAGGIEAYVLLNCELGLEDALMKDLIAMPEVSEVKGVFGVYDIIVRVSTGSEDEIKRVIATIRSMTNIKSSLTMMVIESQGKQFFIA
ncbi:MAG: Lrp/AsnC ligand binding domain-containing protein [Nitrososphaera sp.]